MSIENSVFMSNLVPIYKNEGGRPYSLFASMKNTVKSTGTHNAIGIHAHILC